MAKRILAIADSVPHCYHGGGGIQEYSALRAFRERGHAVRVLALQSSPYNGGRSEQEHIQHLRDVGIEVEILAAPAGAALRRRGGQRLFPGLQHRPAVAAQLGSWNPDGIFMYHWNAIAAAYQCHHAPKFAAVGDPAHLPWLCRREFTRRYGRHGSWLRHCRQDVRDWWNVSQLQRWMRRLLLDCDARGAFAAHHAAEFQQAGVPQCHYLHTPIPDPLDSQTVSARPSRLKILHIGHLKGIASLTGVELLAEEILPRLRAALADDFELHLVGGFYETMPAGLRQRLESFAQVRVRGHIAPPDDEFLSSHIVLVPTPIELGMRVRIATAFSFGNCVVAHVANRKGIPELEHGNNCLLGQSGEELAALCLRVQRQAGLRQALETRARHAYEQWFSPQAAGGQIADILDGILPGRSPARAAA